VLRGQHVTFTRQVYLPLDRKWRVEAKEMDSLSEELAGEADLPVLSATAKSLELVLSLKGEKMVTLVINYRLLNKADFEPGSPVNFYNLQAEITLEKELTGDLPDSYLRISQGKTIRNTTVIE
jgi:hypothetical protein